MYIVVIDPTFSKISTNLGLACEQTHLLTESLVLSIDELEQAGGAILHFLKHLLCFCAVPPNTRATDGKNLLIKPRLPPQTAAYTDFCEFRNVRRVRVSLVYYVLWLRAEVLEERFN